MVACTLFFAFTIKVELLVITHHLFYGLLKYSSLLLVTTEESLTFMLISYKFICIIVYSFIYLLHTGNNYNCY